MKTKTRNKIIGMAAAGAMFAGVFTGSPAIAADVSYAAQEGMASQLLPESNNKAVNSLRQTGLNLIGKGNISAAEQTFDAIAQRDPSYQGKVSITNEYLDQVNTARKNELKSAKRDSQPQSLQNQENEYKAEQLAYREQQLKAQEAALQQQQQQMYYQQQQQQMQLEQQQEYMNYARAQAYIQELNQAAWTYRNLRCAFSPRC